MSESERCKMAEQHDKPVPQFLVTYDYLYTSSCKGMGSQCSTLVRKASTLKDLKEVADKYGTFNSDEGRDLHLRGNEVYYRLEPTGVADFHDKVTKQKHINAKEAGELAVKKAWEATQKHRREAEERLEEAKKELERLNNEVPK